MNSCLRTTAGLIMSASLLLLVPSCSSPRSSEPLRAQSLGEIVVAFDGYDQKVGSGVHAVLLATNVSHAKMSCIAFSYASGLPMGNRSRIATTLDVRTLPNRLVWTLRKPEMHVDPRMMRRYGTGQVFELQPGQHVRLLLPIYVPEAHPDDFVEHLVFGYLRSPSGASDSQGGYETYVAELKR